MQVAKQLARLGVDVIEAGFPFASPDDFAGTHMPVEHCSLLVLALRLSLVCVCACTRAMFGLCDCSHAESDFDQPVARAYAELNITESVVSGPRRCCNMHCNMQTMSAKAYNEKNHAVIKLCVLAAVENIAQVVGNAPNPPIICGLARAVKADIETCAKAVSVRMYVCMYVCKHFHDREILLCMYVCVQRGYLLDRLL
jgi:isopropylmalate/homocitrate/citramalate synthase